MFSYVLLIFLWFLAYIIRNGNAKLQLEVNEYKNVLCTHPSPKTLPAPKFHPWALPVLDDEVLQGVCGIAAGCGIAVGHQQCKPGQVAPIQHGAHIEKRLGGQGHGGALVGLHVGRALEERHPHGEHSGPTHADV